MMLRHACLLLALATPPAHADEPELGRYDGQFCVTVGDAAADCGPALVDVLRERRLNVRISDIVYRLKLNSSQVDVVLMHGTMQIDGFFANYEWAADNTLQFYDIDKRTNYALRLAPRKAAR